MPTILQALTSSNVTIDSRGVPRGSNTMSSSDIWPEDWAIWKEFKYETLTRIFEKELQVEYRGSPVPFPLSADVILLNEGTLEDFLRRFTIPTVNYALAEQSGTPYLGRGSRARSDADWAATSEYYNEDGDTLIDFLPGDTKLDAKWWLRMGELDNHHEEWQRVMSQVVTYMAMKRSRYGFVITDTALVAIRITREPTHPGLARNRPRREVTSISTYGGGHQRHHSDITMASSSVSDSVSGSSYSDNDPLKWGYLPPECAYIPWSNHGKKLTVKLALFCLVMMGFHGDNFIDYSYPPLDSYRTGEGGKGFVHNTSGAKVTKLPKGARRVECDPQRASREEQEARWASESAAGDQDIHHFSQTPSNSGDTLGLYSTDDEAQEDDEGVMSSRVDEENSDEDDEDDNNEDDEEEWEETAVSMNRRRTVVSLKRAFRGGYKFKYKGREVRTERDDWTRVSDGYECERKRHTYYTRELP